MDSMAIIGDFSVNWSQIKRDNGPPSMALVFYCILHLP